MITEYLVCKKPKVAVMGAKSELSRVTIDMPKALHKKLKTCAALQGKSMRGIILDALELTEACRLSDHIPNKTTRKAIKDAQKETNLTRAKDIKDLIKKLGI
jgi:hypothetical protein